MNDPHENATWVYNYDRGGNILSKVKYAYTTGTLGAALETIPYVYGDANWKDKLTAYNGTAITYDAIGNPLNDGSWTYEWAVGRQLKKMSRDGQSLTFKYDHNGMRIQKVLEHSWYPETTNYTYHGKLLTHMEVNYTDFDEVEHTDKFHFFYDAQSCPAKVRFNGTIYTYLHNLQGDIVGILDSNGNLVVEYKYDAWGKPLSTTGSLADTLGIRNPFRYRVYVYDEDSGLYYLRSRYYNPTVERFANEDKLISNYMELTSGNAFSYCRNCPVNALDRNEQKPFFGFEISDQFLESNIVTELPDNELPVPYDKPRDRRAYLKAAGRYATYYMFRNARIAKRQMKKINASSKNFPDELLARTFWFIDKMDSLKIWDFKNTIPVWAQDIGKTDKFIVHGQRMTLEEYGNFHYGFVGTVYGYDKTMLYLGSYYVNYRSHGNWNEDPHDLEMIDAGIEYANECISAGMFD